MSKQLNLTALVAGNLEKVITIISQATFTIAGNKLPHVNQELATLEAIQRNLAGGAWDVVNNRQEVPALTEEEEPDADTN